MPKTVVVLPTYNEAKTLPLMVDALFDLQVDNLNILVVDDNSPDGTGQIADELSMKHSGRLNVLHRMEKAGLGPAYIAGFKKALALDADYVVQMDCDFSHQPKYVPELLAGLETHDLVLGSRYVRGGSVDENWSLYRKALSGFANRIYIPLVLGFPVMDATGGFRAWKRQTLIGIDLDRVRANGYVFQVELAYIAYRLGFTIKEVPIYFPDRKIGQSKMDIRIQREAALRVWEIRANHRDLTPQMRRTTVYS